MFLGNRVDDATTTYFWLRKAGQTLSLEQLRGAVRDLWQDKLAEARLPRGSPSSPAPARCGSA